MTFEEQRETALRLLNKNIGLTRNSGSFLGQLAVDPTPMTPKQTEWLAKLSERAEGGNDD